MTLIIKSIGSTAPAGAKKLYRDALVENGTLLLYDFSNRGTLNNFSVSNGSPVFDLARESSIPLGVNAAAKVSSLTDNNLTPGRGFTPQGYTGAGGQGIIIPSEILDYLSSSQPNSILILWVRSSPSFATAGRLITSFPPSSPATAFADIRITIAANQNGTVVFGRGAGTAISTNGLVQIAVEFRGVGQATRTYQNGQLLGNSGTADGFEGIAENLGIGKMEGAAAAHAALYRMMIEDLSVSSRSALEVVQKDYNYVHALGEFEGIPQRPFVSTY